MHILVLAEERPWTTRTDIAKAGEAKGLFFLVKRSSCEDHDSSWEAASYFGISGNDTSWKMHPSVTRWYESGLAGWLRGD